jgi:DNA repair exonuclease SbcCD nuclease subunit
MSLEAAKDMWFTPLQERGIRMDMLVGNHDIYYKNTLRVNAPSELLGEYDNIRIHTEPTTTDFYGLPILLLPWICDENRAEVLEEIESTEAKVCMGHLELNGFEAHPGHVMNSGMDANVFSKFKKVFSGHYHTKSTKKNVSYLGNPYQLYWNDYGCKRGFHVFDTETLKTTFYRNPFDIFHKLYYNAGVRLPDKNELHGAFVKLIVEEKDDYAKFDYVVKQLQDMSLGDLKIVEDLCIDEGSTSVEETEDTMTLLDKYIDGIDLKVNKSNIKTVMRSLYIEASEL